MVLKVDVKYPYYVSLKPEKWKIQITETRIGVDPEKIKEKDMDAESIIFIKVIAPELSPSDPVIDTDWKVIKGRGNASSEFKKKVRKNLTNTMKNRSVEYVDNVREQARAELEKFLRNWIRVHFKAKYSVTPRLLIDLKFRDELPDNETKKKVE